MHFGNHSNDPNPRCKDEASDQSSKEQQYWGQSEEESKISTVQTECSTNIFEHENQFTPIVKDGLVGEVEWLLKKCTLIQEKFGGVTANNWANSSQSGSSSVGGLGGGGSFVKKKELFEGSCSGSTWGSFMKQESYIVQKRLACPQCEYHINKQLLWLKEKGRLLEETVTLRKRVSKLQKQLAITQQFWTQRTNKSPKQQGLNLIQNVIEFSVKQFSEFHNNRLDSSELSLQLSQIKELQKQRREKELQELRNQLKYLKIDQHLYKNVRDELTVTLKQLQKAQRQRDSFKRKLLLANEKEKKTKNYGRNTFHRPKNTTKQNQELFELSLTDPQIKSSSCSKLAK